MPNLDQVPEGGISKFVSRKRRSCAGACNVEKSSFEFTCAE